MIETMEISHYAILSSSIVVRATIEILLSPALAEFQLPCVKMLFESESQNEAEKLSSLPTLLKQTSNHPSQ
jgi:hypothetical protein